MSTLNSVQADHLVLDLCTLDGTKSEVSNSTTPIQVETTLHLKPMPLEKDACQPSASSRTTIKRTATSAKPSFWPVRFWLNQWTQMPQMLTNLRFALSKRIKMDKLSREELKVKHLLLELKCLMVRLKLLE